MTFKEDFLATLRRGGDYQVLMELVHRHRTRGLSVEDAYDTLQEIWLDYGFNNIVAEDNSLQDTLEAVMEKVWFGQPVI